MRKVPAAQVVTAAEASEMPLPAQVQELLGELVDAAAAQPVPRRVTSGVCA